MNRLTIVIALAAFGLAALPGPARAQSPLEADAGWLVTPAIGIALDSDADMSLTLGAAVAYPLSENLALEGDLAHVFDVAPGDSEVDASVTSVHGSVLYFFTTPFIAAPYVAGGIGIATFSEDVATPSASVDRTEVGFNVGGGVTYPLTERMWGRADFRLFKHIDNLPSLWRFAGGLTIRVGP